MTSEVFICNLALDMLGTDTIESLTQQYSDNAKVCNRWYHHVRRSMITELHPSFAIKRVALGIDDTVTPIYGRTYAYTLPNKCLKILNINDPIEDLQDFQVEGDKLICDEPSPIYLRYLYDEEDVSLFDTDFVNVFAIELALKISYKTTKNADVLSYLEGRKSIAMYNCMFKYGKENKVTKINNNRATISRIGTFKTNGFLR